MIIKPHTQTEARVLAYCNRIRAALKRRAVNGFVKGDPEDALCCVIANTIGTAEVEPDDHSKSSRLTVGDRSFGPLPKYVNSFAIAFDNGKYPHLIEH